MSFCVRPDVSGGGMSHRGEGDLRAVVVPDQIDRCGQLECVKHGPDVVDDRGDGYVNLSETRRGNSWRTHPDKAGECRQ